MKKFVVSKDDLKSNIEKVKDICGGSTVIAVLKGDGYGLGIADFARVLAENGVEFFAVSDISEAQTLRGAGFNQPVLLLTSTSDDDEVDKILELDLTATVGSLSALYKLAERARSKNKSCAVHIKLETGFGRYGFLENEAEELASLLQSAEVKDCLRAEGIYSHFSFSFGKRDDSVKKQLKLFQKIVSYLESRGLQFKIKHIANSCAALRFPYTRLDAVRIGSAFLGRLPLVDTFGLKKIGQLVASISEIKLLPPNHNIGYADTYKTRRDTKIAVINVGYKDGFGVQKMQDVFRIRDILRTMLSMRPGKRICVYINDKKVNLLGRIGMYNVIADVTALDGLKINDIVRLPCNPVLLSSHIERVYE